MTITILYASDLHLEFGDFPYPDMAETDGVDMIVAAGDIAVGMDGFLWLQAWAETLSIPIIYVAGNHEFYDHDRPSLLCKLRKAAVDIGNLHFLENEAVDILTKAGSTWRVLGATLWTDFEAGPYPREKIQKALAETMDDFRMIQEGATRFSPELSSDSNRVSRSFFEDELAKAKADPRISGTVVVTHHPPLLHPWTSEQHLSSSFNAAFCNDWPEFFDGRKIDCWIAGHTHKTDTNEVFKDCHLLGHQRGYPMELKARFKFARITIKPSISIGRTPKST